MVLAKIQLQTKGRGSGGVNVVMFNLRGQESAARKWKSRRSV
jgi:hypothetical protein